jgi:cytochrome bd-type quinol oxidase subunit 2
MKLKNKILILATMLTTFFAVAAPAAYAVSAKDALKCGANAAAGEDCSAEPKGNLNSTVITIINILSALVGVVAVIMIIVSGLRYITSGGATDKITSAKNGLLYAVIGLVLVALAQVIVRFVLHQVTQPNATVNTSSQSQGSSCGKAVC